MNKWTCTVQTCVVQGLTVIYAHHNCSSHLVRDRIKGEHLTQFWQWNMRNSLQESLKNCVFILLLLDTITFAWTPTDVAAKEGKVRAKQYENHRADTWKWPGSPMRLQVLNQTTQILHDIAAAESPLPSLYWESCNVSK